MEDLVIRFPSDYPPEEALEEAIKYAIQAAGLLEDSGIYFERAGNQEMAVVMSNLSAGVTLKIKRRFPTLT